VASPQSTALHPSQAPASHHSTAHAEQQIDRQPGTLDVNPSNPRTINRLKLWV